MTIVFNEAKKPPPKMQEILSLRYGCYYIPNQISRRGPNHVIRESIH